ncbi:MAG: LysE family translocator [Gammaproteobacteria bacterium]|nr:LysE family translocator [Gammaproteobacteria bacterium]
MIDLENLVPIALAFFVVTVSPGPANIAVATVAMSAGRRRGLLFGAGLSCGLAFWGIVAATGMGAALQRSVAVLVVLKVLGGLYLLWLAFQSARSALTRAAVTSEPSADTDGRWFARGLVLNLSNPKAVVAWMAALGMGLGADDSSTDVIAATLLCMALGFVNYAGYAMAFSMAGFMAGYRRMRRSIDAVAASLFAIAGIGLLRSAFSR